MATIQVPRATPPTRIDKFLGLNEDDSGDTQLALGESPNMVNFRLTDNYKLRKREGYHSLFASLGSHDIRGMWYGKVAGSFHCLFAADGHVYEHDLDLGTNSSIGTLTDDITFFIAFANKVYIWNGHEYLSWDGTTFATVAGYIPLIATVTPPAGGGVANEQINLLTGKKYQRFNGDGAALLYQVAETAITSIDFVYVGGVLLTPVTQYTVDLTLGQVIPVIPADFTTGTDNIDIYWTKGTGSRAEITANHYAMIFGGQNDSRLFAYSNGTNRYYFTGLAAGVPSAEYWPPFNRRDIGSSEFAVTDIVRQYDRQLIFTNGMDTHYSYYDPITDVDGNVIADFPTFPLNDAVGNIAPGQAQLIENNPFSIQNGVHEWVATNVRDERNEVYKSKRVQPSLDNYDLSTALTVDWEARKEYWLAIGKMVWIYNYRLDAWYRFLLEDEVTSFLLINNELYFGTPDGEIMKFDPEDRTDNETLISAVWEMGFYAFLAEWLRKFLNRVWISLQPGLKEKIELTWQTDNNASSQVYNIEYNLLGFDDVDFSDYSFSTYYNPQPFRLKIKAKKFVYFKLILTNESLVANATVLSINLLSRMGGETK